jgi:nucleolar complex protein 2
MNNCVVELYSLDYIAAYQYAFVYLRQLAVTLRTALQKKTKDSLTKLYNWQVINSLNLWTNLISSNAQQEELKLLVYPLIQVIVGVIG